MQYEYLVVYKQANGFTGRIQVKRNVPIDSFAQVENVEQFLLSQYL